MARFFSIEERVDRFRKYYRFANDRPLLGFFAASEYPLYRYRAAKLLPSGRPLVPEDFAVSPYLDDCEALFELHEACGGDFIWTASAFWGIPWLEVMIGCPIIADHSTGSIHSEPPIGFTGPDSLAEFDPTGLWMAKAVEFIKSISEQSDGRWPIGTTRMRGIADLLSALYGAEKFLYAMMEKPDEVKQICDRLTDYWITFARLQLDNIPPFHGGVGSFYYNMWAPAGTVWHQEDTAALLSPQLYNEFIRPYDQRITEEFGGCIMHQHPAGYVPTDFYLDMPFTAMELHIDRAGPSAKELYRTYIKILERKPLLIWGDIPEMDLEFIFENLPAKGLAITKVVDNPQQAGNIWSKFIE